MAWVDDLDADRSGVAVAVALPERDPRVPGAALLGDQSEDATVLLDQIVGRHLGLRIAQALQRLLARAHAGVVQHQHVRRRAPDVEVGRRRLDQLHGAGLEGFPPALNLGRGCGS